MRIKRNVAILLFATISLAAIVVSCSGSESEVEPTSGTQPEPTGSEDTSWTAIPNGLNAELATPDLGKGIQRFGVVLSSEDGLLRFPIVRFSVNHYPNGYDNPENSTASQTVTARFYEFPFGTRGIYTTELEFSETGYWSAVASAPMSDGSTASVEVRFRVNERPESVKVGEPVPLSASRTLNSVSDISELTTGSHRDPELYRLSIADTVAGDRPFMVVFASPAFCTNAVCGPQVEVASELREDYGEQFDFLHVDLYENPHEIQGDLSRAVLTPLLDEWRLSSQEWTFVVNEDGIVTHRFENFAPKDELIEAIEEVLGT
jgi:hypothetical protein